MPDRRAWTRLQPQRIVPARVISSNPRGSQGLLLLDAGPGGVRVLTPAALDLLDLVLLDLPGVRLLVARVAHAAERDDGLWVSGCELLTGLGPEELALLVR